MDHGSLPLAIDRAIFLAVDGAKSAAVDRAIFIAVDIAIFVRLWIQPYIYIVVEEPYSISWMESYLHDVDEDISLAVTSAIYLVVDEAISSS